MRSYGSRQDYTTENRLTTTEYKNRKANAWDIRFDTANIDIDAYVESVKKHIKKILYLLVSGKEFGSNPLMGKPGAFYESEHVHIAFISYDPMTRTEVLEWFRPKKETQEYCTPRNAKFTYLGWRIHHVKDETKITDKRILYESGTLPMDRINEKNANEIRRMLNKFPGPYDDRYEELISLVREQATKKRKLERITEEVPRLQEEIKQIDERLLMSKEDK